MHTAAPDWPQSEPWPRRAVGYAERGRDWLDARGRKGWIIAMILGFILFWPIGLALLAYMIWSNRMSCNGWGRRSRHHNCASFRDATAPTGNVAFDAYRAETLRRLEEEREAFSAFLEQLRAAKDQAEFDQFMASRRAPAPSPEAN